jgi:predicted GH43/DUF377 family glycosyl hydrolase
MGRLSHRASGCLAVLVVLGAGVFPGAARGQSESASDSLPIAIGDLLLQGPVPAPQRKAADPILAAWERGRATAARRRAPAVRREEGMIGGAPRDVPRPWERRNTGGSSTVSEKYALNPVLPLGKGGAIDNGHAEYPAIVFAGNTMWMFYSAYGATLHRWEIAAAVSENGLDWTKLGSVITPDTALAAWDSSTVAFPSVLFHPEGAPGERFRMWYAGKHGPTYDGVGFATSADGRQWVRQGRVLTTGAPGEWDGAQLADPAVIEVEGGYRMYYCGAQDPQGLFQVGVAYSADGHTWEKDPDNPICSFAATTHGGAYTLDVIRSGPAGGYTLFVALPNTAHELEIYALTSPDGITFDPAAREMVLAPSRDGTWDDQMVYGMEAVEIGDYVYLWFNGMYARAVAKGGVVGAARVPRAEIGRLLYPQP